MLKQINKAHIGVLLTYLFLLLVAAYGIDRVSVKYFTPYSFETFFGLVTLLFLLVAYIYKKVDWIWSGKIILFIGIGIRVLLLFTEPNLSDDYYRYLWDGHLTANGINPYLYLPSEIIKWPKATELGLTESLYHLFNSQHYYSVYPPVSQLLFALSSWIGGTDFFMNTLVLRSFIILAETGTLFILLKLLRHHELPEKTLLLYALNPLVLLELTVNLHFEGILIFYLLTAIYFFYQSRPLLAGAFWGMAICTKMLPLVFLVFLFKRTSFRNILLIGLSTLATITILFLPFWEFQIIANINDSLTKYFGYFQFNSGITYFIEYIGYQYVDYSILFKVMPKIKIGILFFIGLYALYPLVAKHTSKLEKPIFWTGMVYFLFAGILHPWYITFLIPIGLLSKNRSILIWSWLIFLSYSAYRTAEYQENMYLIGVEFIGILLIILLEKTSLLSFLKPLNQKNDFD